MTRPGDTPSRWVRALLVACCAPLVGCAADEIDIHEVARLDYEGRVERIETLGRYSAIEAALLFSVSGARSKVSAQNDYYLYRVIYPTQGVDGGVERVSGLLGVPATRRIKGLVSWQHGTNTFRPNSISKPSLPEGLGVAAVFSGDGYILTAADYIGLGVSEAPQAYYHWPSTVQSVIDLMSIGEIVMDGLADDPDHDLYLAGFSQGGGASAAVHRALEEDNQTGLELRATAAIAGAYSLRWISLPSAIARSKPLHFALVATAFAQVYGGSLEDILRKPYSELMPIWFNGTKRGPFIEENLPSRIEDLLTERFLSDYEAGIEAPEWFYAGLEAAETGNFAPRAPLRIHFGHEDTIVIPEEAHSAFANMRALGGNVELVDVGAYGHENIVVATLPYVQQWFNAVERRSP